MRICSLLPSATEIVCALGLEEALVGVSHECDYPPSVRGKPALIRPRVDPDAAAAEIDGQVRALVERGESLYAVDAELLLRLEPDLILTQDLCHVCAASPGDLAAALARVNRPPRVLSLTPQSLADVWRDIRAVGEATGRRQEAEALASNLTARVRRVQESAAASSAAAGARPRVVCLEWLSPLYAAGHWVPEMVQLAGGEDVLARPGQASFRIEWQQLFDAQPEVIVIMPCGYSEKKAAKEFSELRLPAGWAGLPAMKNRRVFVVDANSYFSRPGPRLADGVELLARLLEPQQAGATHAGHSLETKALAISRSHG